MDKVYRTFVNVSDLSNTIIELSKIKYNGILHAGPLAVYSVFYNKRENKARK